LRLGRALTLWGPLALYALAIFLASGRSNPPVADLASDKLLHAAAYAVFAVLAYRALHGGLGRYRPAAAAGAVALSAVYGGLDELHQALVPGRFPSAGDWLADVSGALAATVVLAVLARLRQGRARAARTTRTG
jgi:VanZ family protein